MNKYHSSKELISLILFLLISIVLIFAGCGSDNVVPVISPTVTPAEPNDLPAPGDTMNFEVKQGDKVILSEVYDYYVIDPNGTLQPYTSAGDANTLIPIWSKDTVNLINSRFDHVTVQEVDQFIEDFKNYDPNTTTQDFLRFLKEYGNDDIELLYGLYKESKMSESDYLETLVAITGFFPNNSDPLWEFFFFTESIGLGNLGDFNAELAKSGTSIKGFLSKIVNNGYNFNTLVEKYDSKTWVSKSEYLTYVMNNAYTPNTRAAAVVLKIGDAVIKIAQEIIGGLIDLSQVEPQMASNSPNQYILAGDNRYSDPFLYQGATLQKTQRYTVKVSDTCKAGVAVRCYYKATIPDAAAGSNGYYIPSILSVFDNAVAGATAGIQAQAALENKTNSGGNGSDPNNMIIPSAEYVVRLGITQVAVGRKTLVLRLRISGDKGIEQPEQVYTE